MKKIILTIIIVIFSIFTIFIIPVSCASCNTVSADIIKLTGFSPTTGDIEGITSKGVVLDLGNMITTNGSASSNLMTTFTSLKLHCEPVDDVNTDGTIDYRLTFYVPSRRTTGNIYDNRLYDMHFNASKRNDLTVYTYQDFEYDIPIFFNSFVSASSSTAGIERRFTFDFTFDKSLVSGRLTTNPTDILKTTKLCTVFTYLNPSDEFYIIYRGYDFTDTSLTTASNTIWTLSCYQNSTGSQVPSIEGNTRHITPILGFVEGDNQLDYDKGFQDGLNSREPIQSIVTYVNEFFDIRPFGNSFKLGHLVGIAVSITVLFFGLKILRT